MLEEEKKGPRMWSELFSGGNSLVDGRSNTQAVMDAVTPGSSLLGFGGGQTEAPSAMSSLLSPEGLTAPVSPFEQAKQNHGDGFGFFMKSMLVAKNPALAGWLMPELSAANLAQYKNDLSVYNSIQSKMIDRAWERKGDQEEGERLSLIDSNIIDAFATEDTRDDAIAVAAGLRSGLTLDQIEALRYGVSDPNATTSPDLPEATRAVLYYQDSLNTVTDPATSETKKLEPGDEGYVKYSDAYDLYKNRDPEGLYQQSFSKAGGSEQGKLEVNETAKNESQIPQMQVGYDLVTELLEDPDKTFHNIYGVIDAMTPTVRQSSADAEAKIKQITDILYMFARGDLKGQGQVTEQEAEAARNAASRIGNMKQSEGDAEKELLRLQNMFLGKLQMGAGNDAQGSAGGTAPPKVGEIIGEFRFKGGDPNNRNNWEPAS